jgi:glutaredoxin
MKLFNKMYRHIISTTLVVLSLSGLQGCMLDKDSEKPFQEGVHFRELSGIEKTDNNQVILFFSAACPHCKKFDEYLKGWEQQRASNITYERIPVTFAKKEWALLSKIYSVGRQLGEQDKVIHALFKSIQEDRIWWTQDYEVIQWFGDLGFDLQRVDDLWRSHTTVNLMQRYKTTESRYAVSSIPRLIINGKYELITKGFEYKNAADQNKPSPESKIKISNAINYILTL